MFKFLSFEEFSGTSLKELKEAAKKKGCPGTSSMNRSQLIIYLDLGVKYKKNQVHIGVQIENSEFSECSDCALQTLKKKLKKEAEERDEKN